MKRCEFRYDDGGRAAAGYKGDAGDCVTRAIAIAAQLPYESVRQAIATGQSTQRITRGTAKNPSPDKGVLTNRKWFLDYMKSIGWKFIPTMGIGSGCKVHLLADELPKGRIICRVSKHWVAVIDGVIHDTGIPDRNGTRCVYGYWVEDKPTS